ncbi:hypothetical protein [Roseateles oligotrophus]|uniref:Uncharacterized protein n=1 Tax=Roseateles oligotrophus TaxID=1769250 RepID=A0ABT2YAP0_9BURK|nr:hypothetical protein [Roseateles oligotrophus]MCV2367125.1 hypothetical protein [Roseateles oligotrophus]
MKIVPVVEFGATVVGFAAQVYCPGSGGIGEKAVQKRNFEALDGFEENQS